MKKSKKNKIIFKLIIGLLIILILLAIIIFFLKKEENENDEPVEKLGLEAYDEMMEEMVMPNGIFMLKKTYSGENDLNDFYRGIRTFSLYIPKIISKLKNATDEKIMEYYEKNTSEVTHNTGITKNEDFITLVNYLKGYDGVKSLQTATIDTDSFKNTNQNLAFNITFNYDNGSELEFKAYFKNKVSYSGELFIFKVIDN